MKRALAFLIAFTLIAASTFAQSTGNLFQRVANGNGVAASASVSTGLITATGLEISTTSGHVSVTGGGSANVLQVCRSGSNAACLNTSFPSGRAVMQYVNSAGTNGIGIAVSDTSIYMGLNALTSGLFPSGTLHVSGTIALNNNQYLQGRGSGGALGNIVGVDTNTNVILGNLNLTNAGIIVQANGNERMRIVSTGLVGISLTAPNAALDVNGVVSSTAMAISGTTAALGVQGVSVTVPNLVTAYSMYAATSPLARFACAVNSVGAGFCNWFNTSGVIVHQLGGINQNYLVGTGGFLGVGTTIPSNTLGVSGSLGVTGGVSLTGLASNAGTNPVCINTSTGVLSYSTACTASDESLKIDIETRTGGLARIAQLRPVTFHWREPDVYGYGLKIGFIAQEVSAVIPEAVFANEDGTLGLDKESLIPDLVAAIKELKARVEALEQ